MEYGPHKIEVDANGDKHYFRNGVEYKIMNNTQTEMGKISNLITDMTLIGAPDDKLARAVRHSMVVIDAEKHKLDYRKSEEENNIAALKKEYQGRIDPETGKYHEGAATLISRAKHEESVLKRRGSPRIDPDTGEVTYKEVYEEYVDKKGKVQVRTQSVPLMSTIKDAHAISSGTIQEGAYANYANNLKALANDARKELIATGKIKYSASAKGAYQKEVDSLKDQLNVALMNAPRERTAQLAANSEVRAKKANNPDMTTKELKKAGQQALSAARIKFGAERSLIKISDREWEAIQSGAISENILSNIIKNTDIDDLRQRAMPRTSTSLSPAKVARIHALQASGYTTAEIAKALDCAPSTVSKQLTGKE
jgi:DNA-binding NarL/FixJ family response regulator